jgi:uncharacterized cupredoxin-like copper-binding protein
MKKIPGILLVLSAFTVLFVSCPSATSDPDDDGGDISALIQILENGTVLQTGYIKDFGSVVVGATSSVATYTIKNVGTSSLTFGAGTISATGTDASMFPVTLPAVTSLAPNSETTFTVGFAPASAGLKTVTASIKTTEMAAAATFTLKGTGAAGDLLVLAGATPVAGGGTVQAGYGYTGEITPETVYTIKNTGTNTLNLTGTPKVAVSGTHATDFTVTQPTVSTLAPNVTTTFTVKFDPQGFGTRTATLTIANDSPSVPAYTFTVQGTAPEIKVYFAYDETGWEFIPPGGTINYDAVDYYLNNSYFHFNNDGGEPYSTANLAFQFEKVGPSPSVTINVAGFTGPDASAFSMPDLPYSLTGGEPPTFEIVYSFPYYTEGSKSIGVSLPNSSMPVPYSFGISFTATSDRKLRVYEGEALLYPNEITLDFDSSEPKTLRVQNEGLGKLTVTNIILSGPEPGEFVLFNLPEFPIVITDNFFEFEAVFSGNNYSSATIEIHSNTDDAVEDEGISSIGIFGSGSGSGY